MYEPAEVFLASINTSQLTVAGETCLMRLTCVEEQLQEIL